MLRAMSSRRQGDVQRPRQDVGERRWPGGIEREHDEIAVLALGREHASGHRVQEDAGRVADARDGPDDVEPAVRAQREEHEVGSVVGDGRRARSVERDNGLAALRQKGDSDRIYGASGIPDRIGRALEHRLEAAIGGDPEGGHPILPVLDDIRDVRTPGRPRPRPGRSHRSWCRRSGGASLARRGWKRTRRRTRTARPSLRW